jgi:hypothetical protein
MLSTKISGATTMRRIPLRIGLISCPSASFLCAVVSV